MLAALNFSLVKAKQVVFAAKPDAQDLKPMLRSLHKPFIPNKIILLADGGSGQSTRAKHLAFLKTVEPIENRATAFVCEDFVYQLPTTEVAQFETLLKPKSEGATNLR